MQAWLIVPLSCLQGLHTVIITKSLFGGGVLRSIFLCISIVGNSEDEHDERSTKFVRKGLRLPLISDERIAGGMTTTAINVRVIISVVHLQSLTAKPSAQVIFFFFAVAPSL